MPEITRLFHSLYAQNLSRNVIVSKLDTKYSIFKSTAIGFIHIRTDSSLIPTLHQFTRTLNCLTISVAAPLYPLKEELRAGLIQTRGP
jgi:hypothetical protein